MPESFFPPGDSEAVAACIRSVIEEPSLVGRVGTKARCRALERVMGELRRALIVSAFAVVLLIIDSPEAAASRFAFYPETLEIDSPKSEWVFRAHDYPLANLSLHSTTLGGRMGMAQEQRRLERCENVERNRVVPRRICHLLVCQSIAPPDALY
jgi:hypothetical protein